MKKIKRLLFLLLMLVIALNFLPANQLNAKAATKAPELKVKLVTDKILENKEGNTYEAVTLKITNKSKKAITILPYSYCSYYFVDGDGGLGIFRTKSGKKVSIPAGKTKKITFITREGYISFNGQDPEIGGSTFSLNYKCGKTTYSASWINTNGDNQIMKVGEKPYISSDDYLEMAKKNWDGEF